MMQFGLLENGIDSLKVTGDILLEYYQDYEFQNYQIKDAVFSFVHGVEVLAKHIIKSDDESKIFTDKNRYHSAKQRMTELNKDNVFEVDNQLRTITVTSAINILKANKRLPSSSYEQLEQIINLRNQLMHYTVNLEEDEFLEFVTMLRENYQDMVEYFVNNISNFKEVFNRVVREAGLTEYDVYLDELETQALIRAEDARLEAQAEYYETLEEYHKH